MPKDSEDEQFKKLQRLVRRKQELQDRRSLLRVEKLNLQQRVGELSAAEAALNEQRELAAAADRMVQRQDFAHKFCELYEKYRSIAEAVAGIAEIASMAIKELYPPWVAQPETLLVVGILTSTVIVERTVKVYCNIVNRDNEPSSLPST